MSVFEETRLADDQDELYTSLVERFMKFGLTKSEAKVYLSLLRLREGKGDSVARHSGIARQEAYRVLSNLEELELVDRIVANPTRFRPAPLLAALARLIEDEKGRSNSKLREIQQARDEIVNQFGSLKNELGEGGGYLFLMHGRRIFEREIELIRDSKEKVLLAASAYDLARLHHYGATALIRRSSQSRCVNMICTKSLKLFEDIQRAYESFDLKCVHSFAGHILLVDGRKTVVKVEEKKALETDDEMFVQAMEYLFEVLWRNASPIKELERTERDTVVGGGRNSALEPRLTCCVILDRL